MPVKRALFVSDLHLCSSPALDDFQRDDEFAAFLELPELTPGGGEEVDLVLLGDSFDLWQSVSDEECRQARARGVDLGITGAAEARRLALVQARHAAWFEAVGAFGKRPGCRLVFVTGNHDHTLLAPEVRKGLTGLLGLDDRPPLFANSYADPALRLYADHGNQYDADNTYLDFARIDDEAECPGYYFVKLFFNRIEYLDPRIENSPGGWGNVWHYLRRAFNLRLLATAIRYFGQYWTDARVPRRISPLRAAGAEQEPLRLESPAAPLLLLTGAETRSAGAFFCADPEMEHFFRVAYEESPEVRLAVNELLAAEEARPAPAGAERSALRSAGRKAPARRPRKRKANDRRRSDVPRPGPRRPGPGSAGGQTRGLLSGPEDVEWAERLFQEGPAFQGKLERSAVDFVLFGHTHGPLARRLSNGATYLNTGTWNAELPDPTLVLAEAAPGKAPSASLLKLRGGALVPF